MKDSDVIVLEEPCLSLGDQFYLPQVLKGLGTTMKHMLKVLGGTDRVVQYPEERREDIPIEDGGMLLRTYRGVHRLNKDEEGRVFHTYSSYARGIDILNTAYNYLDLVPKGRDESELEFTQAWVRYHDRYDA